MPQFLSPMHLLESHNPYPDCISLQLEATPASSSRTPSQQFDLYLTVQFNEQWKSLLDGRIRFGLKGGELKLKIEGGELSSVNSDIGKGFQVATTISKINPTWRFFPKSSELYLKGSLQRVKLATLMPTEPSYRLAATFEVSQSDISLTNAEDLWRHDISPNKHGILERAIALLLLENRFKPYLSWTQLGSEDTKDWQPLVEGREATLNPDLLMRLKQLIERIYEAQTDNFLELAKLAGLNPLTDLAGGNFLAVNLSGSELSGADLSRANFRGANLTDIDLSEANLSYAKLSGADLSGAYLGNANLSYGDLRRASLALVNAIAADFTGADLGEANLSNANFSRATVLQARFSHNPGLLDEVRHSLKERGAIVE
ncbi:low-complexity protein [Hydrococcus rivularis NIES-593]|uniref:Low-complexity protein n=1 Tax=Hydrococcus rivularis NIES-593 TaxID=1921803 RepID=A0A1U7H8T8_9CYAN|nr:pentapeptide repeat-containing protein [Hydrococcus rivularis]OKH19842.1 low-complexity protein [Hydrococcus rivularis NIES-593]